MVSWSFSLRRLAVKLEEKRLRGFPPLEESTNSKSPSTVSSILDTWASFAKNFFFFFFFLSCLPRTYRESFLFVIESHAAIPCDVFKITRCPLSILFSRCFRNRDALLSPIRPSPHCYHLRSVGSFTGEQKQGQVPFSVGNYSPYLRTRWNLMERSMVYRPVRLHGVPLFPRRTTRCSFLRKSAENISTWNVSVVEYVPRSLYLVAR